VSDLHAITGLHLIKALKKTGFKVLRTKGNHRFLKHPDGRCTVVPVHAGETIGRGLLGQILQDCELSPEDLKKLL
jgi:predicted RNA binding protein YcfA (HicA-like mRNA interferase family)